MAEPDTEIEEDEEPRPGFLRRIGPRAWLGITGALLVAAVALGVMVILGVNGDSSQTFVTVTCQIGTTGCEARQATHEHADFALFINGTEFSFDQPQFLSTTGHDLSPDVHIHAPRYTVVHVHTTNTEWSEFFSSLGFKLIDPSFLGTAADKTCLTMPDKTQYCQTATDTFKFYVNGVKVDGITDTNIHDLDRVLVSYGPETDAQVVAVQLPQVTDQACIPSERCKSRIPADEPPEQCTISNNTCVKPGG
ncbi:MAG: hypothetical protein ACRDG3_05135 [Tepidiformaceae bacterium]